MDGAYGKEGGAGGEGGGVAQSNPFMGSSKFAFGQEGGEQNQLALGRAGMAWLSPCWGLVSAALLHLYLYCVVLLNANSPF